MLTPEQAQNTKELIERSNSIILVLPEKFTPDLIASAGGMYSLFSFLKKEVSFVCGGKLDENYQKLPAVSQIKTTLGNRNLCVSFPYVPEQVDKVSYHISDDQSRFFLTIKPQTGYEALDSSQVEFSLVGAETDLIILVGVKKYEDLGELYIGYEDFFASSSSITINGFESDTGQLKLDISGSTCMSEVLAKMFLEQGFEFTSDAATLFLFGIEQSTKHFSSIDMGPDAFETIAQLMRQGARRVKTDLNIVSNSSSSKVIAKPKRSSTPLKATAPTLVEARPSLRSK